MNKTKTCWQQQVIWIQICGSNTDNIFRKQCTSCVINCRLALPIPKPIYHSPLSGLKSLQVNFGVHFHQLHLTYSSQYNHRGKIPERNEGLTWRLHPALSHTAEHEPITTQPLRHQTHTQCNLTMAASEGGCNMSSLVTSGPGLWGSLSRKQWHPWQKTNSAARFVACNTMGVWRNRGSFQ